MVKNKNEKENGWSQSLEKPEEWGTRGKEINMSDERTGSQQIISKQMLEKVKLLQQEKKKKKEIVRLIPELWEKESLVTDMISHQYVARVPNIMQGTSANRANFLQTLKD